MPVSEDLIPITDRFELEELTFFLDGALKNVGVKIPYEYAVYSNSTKKFVIENGSYLILDGGPTTLIEEAERELYTSIYKVDLFPESNGGSPGTLFISFPDKKSYLWSKIWKQLFLVLMFTAIIIFCFAYIFKVIFTQKKISEMKNDFINNMTHEFKTPIATISLASDSITNPKILPNPKKVLRFADIIRQENRRMNAQVEKVLQIALVEKKDFELKITTLDIHNIVQAAADGMGLIIEDRDGQIDCELNAKKHKVQGDYTHISNVINNLLDNANKYSPEHPKISIKTYNQRSGINIEVRDNGMGMDKEAVKHIFDKFYRIHTGNIHDVKGFGLGLSYVKAIVDAHYGEVKVKSELGVGSTFTLYFPFKQPEV